MKRGDFVTIVVQGDFGKPRPALVIQTDSREQGVVMIIFLSDKVKINRD